jgi:suppressor of G2 allele of SKP1
MEKKVANEKWSFLRRDGLGIPESAVENNLNYPSSAKVKHNWQKLDKEIEGDMLDHYEDYGMDSGDILFKQIYQNGDEEKRRAMMKSFQTSGGTVLSTDWNDVKSKDYEGRDRPEAPGGQEWRKPEY